MTCPEVPVDSILFGPGFSPILFDDGRLYTMYRDGEREESGCLFQ